MNDWRDEIRDQRVVCTWSGGMDTTCLIPLVIEECNAEVYPIFVNRGQRAYSSELDAVLLFDEVFFNKYKGNFHSHFKVTTRIPPEEIRHRMPDDKSKSHVLRNSDIINQAVRYALIEGIDYIIIGATIGDDEDDSVRDNSNNYIRIKTEEIREGTGNFRLTVLAPFQELNWHKKDMVAWCAEHEIPLFQSWSCWYPGEKHCGGCSPCQRRKNAYEQAGVPDGTPYDSD